MDQDAATAAGAAATAAASAAGAGVAAAAALSVGAGASWVPPVAGIRVGDATVVTAGATMLEAGAAGAAAAVAGAPAGAVVEAAGGDAGGSLAAGVVTVAAGAELDAGAEDVGAVDGECDALPEQAFYMVGGIGCVRKSQEFAIGADSGYAGGRLEFCWVIGSDVRARWSVVGQRLVVDAERRNDVQRGHTPLSAAASSTFPFGVQPKR